MESDRCGCGSRAFEKENGCPRREGYDRASCSRPWLVVAACGGGGGGGGGEGGQAAEADSGTGEIKIWGHQGEEAEVAALQKAISAFNSSKGEVKATLQLIPSADYTKTVTATSPEQLPDVLEYDGPLMASFAYAKKLSPIEGLVSPATIDNQTDSVKARDTYAGDNKLYQGAAMYDSGLGIYGNKKLLDAARVTYPKDLSDVWTADQFQAALEQLAAKDKDKKVLDLKENYGGEWPTYGFLPVVNSTGNVVVKDNTAEGNLNNPSVVKAVEQFAGWRQYVDPNSDDKAFTQGRVAPSWVGHWLYNGYEKALGDDLVVLPLPDFGAGTKSGHGSWAWGIEASSKNGKAAGKFLDFLMNDDNVKAMTDGNAAPRQAPRRSSRPAPCTSRAARCNCSPSNWPKTCNLARRPTSAWRPRPSPRPIP